MKSLNLISLMILLAGCAATGGFLGQKLNTPPEFNQKIILEVQDNYQLHQAAQSDYDIGDLQSFHTQHTLPLAVEDAFKEMFGQVQVVKSEAGIEMTKPAVPAIFEVKLIDLGHDIYNEATSYRSQVTLAVAMKSPGGKIFWQKAFRGEGYANADPQFGQAIGPQDAVLDGLQNALTQMQDAIIASPEVRAQMKYYAASDAARQGTEVQTTKS